MVTKQRMTLEEYLALPEEKPYLEYVCGEVRPKQVAPSYEHSSLAAELAFLLKSYIRAGAGGSVMVEPRVRFESGPGTRAYVLDVAYWAPGRPIGDYRAMSPPTLAVEVRSPGQSPRHQRERCRYFRSQGVPVCWLVDPETQAVELFEGGRDGETAGKEATLTSQELPGFSLRLEDLFASLEHDQHD
jgi:Uma2 family endonuclease